MSSYDGIPGERGESQRRIAGIADIAVIGIGKPKTLPLMNTDGTDKGK
jgi:hypothetical protein